MKMDEAQFSVTSSARPGRDVSRPATQTHATMHSLAMSLLQHRAGLPLKASRSARLFSISSGYGIWAVQ